MMTSRIAVGSVSTLALGAVLLGSASFLVNRPATASHESPWGNISSLSPGAAAAAQADDKAQLLKLAALKAGSSAPPAPATAEPAAPTASASVAAAPAVPAPAPSAAADAVQAAPAPMEAPVQMASVADPAPSAEAPVQDEPAGKSNLINLNTAPASALDRIPGLGRVGRSIVAHRPYRSVKDLVNKRVLRTSDYGKIASYVSVE